MKLITVTDDRTSHSVQRILDAGELATISGVQLAALLFPVPSDSDVETVNDFLNHHRGAAK